VDDFGFTSINADIIAPDSSYSTIQLWSLGGDTYGATLSIPPNYTDNAVAYGVIVYAIDTTYQYSNQIPLGPVYVDAQPQFDELPSVSNATIEPSNLPKEGGAVTIRADATDTRGISEVYATISWPDGTTSIEYMSPYSGSGFEATFTAPPNTRQAPLVYNVEITAMDDIGQSATTGAGAISVEAGAGPSRGRIGISRSALSFGRVPVGQLARLTFVIRNNGKPGTTPITGIVASPAAPYRVLGAGPVGKGFHMPLGAERTFWVEYRPTSLGVHVTTLTIRRDDLGQPPIVIRLSGRGIPKGTN
jgi:hypothetical protein